MPNFRDVEHIVVLLTVTGWPAIRHPRYSEQKAPHFGSGMLSEAHQIRCVDQCELLPSGHGRLSSEQLSPVVCVRLLSPYLI